MSKASYIVCFQFHADELIHRDLNSHKHYLTLVDSDTSGRNSTTYGINGSSPLIELKGFDVTKCFPYDVMHSVFEGVARRHLILLFHHIIEGSHYLSLADLNHLIKSHPYGYAESDTKPIPVERESAIGSDFHFKLSGIYAHKHSYFISCFFTFILQLHK